MHATDVALQLDTPQGATEVPREPALGKVAREKRAAVRKKESHRSDLNRRPLDYESRALPLSYSGRSTSKGRTPVRPRIHALARIRTATPCGTTPSR